jgi:hypothetical protein
MIRENELIPYLERAWPTLKERLEERVTILEDPDERSAYRGLFTAADLTVDIIDGGPQRSLMQSFMRLRRCTEKVMKLYSRR